MAHRGASVAAPEHTHHAYELAVAQGADVLEVDVRATVDGELVVVHDPTLLRTAGDPRRVDYVTRADLEGLTPCLRPLTLDAVLEAHGQAIRLLIELKDPQPWWERLLVEAVDRHGLADRVALQSFDLSALRRLRLFAQHLPLASLHRGRPSSRTLDAVARYVTGVCVHHVHADAALVGAARSRGLTAHAWTVNSAPDIARALAAGVDGVITDVPGVAAASVQAAWLADAA